jgi:hypothetical protein
MSKLLTIVHRKRRSLYVDAAPPVVAAPVQAVAVKPLVELTPDVPASEQTKSSDVENLSISESP